MWFRPPRHTKRILYVLLGSIIGVATVVRLSWDTLNEIPDRWHSPFLNTEPRSSLSSPTAIFELDVGTDNNQHSIFELITQADDEFRELLSKQTTGCSAAAQAYRKRRGRHPPPWFDQWHAFAQARNSTLIEDLFDRIYHDLNPFWAVPADRIRADAAATPNYIRIRGGKVSRSTEKKPFMDSYFDLIQQIEELLPDMDIPINHMDESRILVPWDRMVEYMATHTSSLEKQDLLCPLSVDNYTEALTENTKPELSFTGTTPYWDLVKQTCSPDTDASTSVQDVDFTTPPIFPSAYPQGSHAGFVQNWTLSQDVCLHPHLRNMHGTFVEPISISTSTTLIPMFSGSKLLANNDILLPAAAYWSEEERFAATSGGRNTKDNWTRFQRHRLVSMLNGTQVEMTLAQQEDTTDNTSTAPAVSNNTLPHNFPPPNNELYPLISHKLGLLPDWIRSFCNVAFYWLECFPATRSYSCPYTGPWYRRGRPVPMQRMYLNKYLLDIDGNSFSGRYRAFLKSNSLPIKASIYTEWHDSRLIPWKHFVPVDNTFMDLWSVLEFVFGRDEVAGRIAVEGREWADRVLRREDMLVYVYRLLLEYARVSHPERERMGFGDDLKQEMFG